ncbi:hypothetical protein Cantr_06987 [Candida viswanathii]|uniref:Uncharacterized protein n=1 Tax=Candida viswanathii TaxID=5486 RepID=A0A367XVN9_9ASCO|nr:hypothetical protein Cantr_06987 [Candida viswanathii]
MSSQLTKQDTKQAELKEYLEEQGKKSGDETRSLVSSTLKVETNTEDIKSLILKLEKSVQALEEKLPPTDIIHQITAPIIAELQAVSLDAKTVQLLESILETTKKSTQKDPTLDLILQKLDGLGKAQPSATQENLEEKYNKLEAKYAELCKSYTAKFDDYKRLQKNYQELQEQIESTQIPTTNRESKMENLNNFHKLKVGQIEKNDFISERKRIASTPMVKLRNTNFSNNSDEE